MGDGAARTALLSVVAALLRIRSPRGWPEHGGVRWGSRSVSPWGSWCGSRESSRPFGTLSRPAATGAAGPGRWGARVAIAAPSMFDDEFESGADRTRKIADAVSRSSVQPRLERWTSLSACVLDAVWSVGTNHDRVVVPL